jgi:single-strand DNA-binding protein
MAGSVNKVILVGNLGADPEIRRLNSGDPVVNLRVATTETWRDRNSGDRQERTEWHRVVIFNDNLAKVAEQYLKKGAKVYIEGQLQTRKWQDQSGQERYSTEIVLQKFRGELQMLDSRGLGGDSQVCQSGGSGGGLGRGGGSDFGQSGPSDRGSGSSGGGFGRDLDDEIPF